MNIRKIKSELEKYGCVFRESYSSKMGIDIYGDKTDDCIIHQIENYPYCIYEFKNEDGAEKWFKNWSEYYKDVSDSQIDIDNKLKYKKCEQNIINNGYYFVLIKKSNIIFWATELWNEKQRLEIILKEINYFK